jgi:glycine cleavage system pyridoxal-binding protein P
MVANDVGNWVPDNLNEQQINGIIERAERERAAGRIPQNAMQLPLGVRIVNGEVQQLGVPPAHGAPHAHAWAEVQVRPGRTLGFSFN